MININLRKEENKDRSYSVLVQDKHKLKENTTITRNISNDTKLKEGVLDDKRVISSNGNFKREESKTISESNELTQIHSVINKDEVLESLAKIFYETQMLSNDSPITKELVAIENAASKIHQDLKACLISMETSNVESRIDSRSPQEVLTEAMGDVCNLRFCLEKLINTFEGIREKLYPPVEKVTLIELEKNHYQLPGAEFKRIILPESKTAKINSNEEEEKINTKIEKSEESNDLADEELFYDCNNENDVFVQFDNSEPSQRDQSICINERDNELPWRTTLPYLRPPGLKFSVWSIIKSAIGKDITKFSVPAYFNEPISMLQKGGEAMEYEDLLVKANNCDDSLLRIAYISAFNCSQYANLEERTLKPCNPVLGETYELVTNYFKFVAEQVSHHPPITACHASSKDYEVYMHTDVKSNFKSTSLHFTPKGNTHIILKGKNEHYVVNRPVTTANNLIIGTLYLDLAGETVAVNRSTGDKCVFRFIKRGWSNKNAYKVEGEIFDGEGNHVYDVYGHWHRALSVKINKFLVR